MHNYTFFFIFKKQTFVLLMQKYFHKNYKYTILCQIVLNLFIL